MHFLSFYSFTLNSPHWIFFLEPFHYTYNLWWKFDVKWNVNNCRFPLFVQKYISDTQSEFNLISWWATSYISNHVLQFLLLLPSLLPSFISFLPLSLLFLSSSLLSPPPTMLKILQNKVKKQNITVCIPYWKYWWGNKFGFQNLQQPDNISHHYHFLLLWMLNNWDKQCLPVEKRKT